MKHLMGFCLDGFCFHREIVTTAVKTAVVVGTILALINHFDSIIALDLRRTQIIQIVITYFVPYAVATYGGAKHAQHMHREHGIR